VEYRPELDGIRAVAVLAVVGFHSFVFLAGGGWMGVDVFFVLSGYLITSILLTEHRRTGQMRMGNFYVRRMLRLYPALLLTLVLGVFFYKYLGDGGTLVGYAKTAAAAGLYVENFIWAFTGNEVGSLGHTWSLAVEMQFYLVWPPLLAWLVLRKKPLLTWALAGAGVCFVLFVVQAGMREEGAFAFSYYLPWTRGFELLLGAAVAIHELRAHGDRAARKERPPRRWVGWVLAALTGIVVVSGAYLSIVADPKYLTSQALSVSVLTALMIMHLNKVRATGVGAVLAWRPLAAIGKISYGIYLFHYPITIVLREQHGLTDPGTMLMVTTVLSIAIAALSYRFVERPALRMRSRLRPVRVPGEPEATPERVAPEPTQ
jgi:peptidoglycan/LPS O-acetylase OafA/YrhL